MGAILETHIKKETGTAFINRTLPNWHSTDNFVPNESGRILVFWEPSISVFVYHKSDQLIVCGVYIPESNLYFTVCFIYAHNCLIQRRILWEKLTDIKSHPLVASRPLILLGDFNQILKQAEHYSIPSSLAPTLGMDEMRTCFEHNNIQDIAARGAFYTWTNKRPEGPILRKLDRALINDIWNQSFPTSFAIFDPPGSSDHSPTIIQLALPAAPANSHFKFFLHVTTHPSYTPQLAASWLIPGLYGTAQYRLSRQLMAAKSCVRQLNRQHFSNIQLRVTEAAAKLQQIQQCLLTNPTQTLFNQEDEASQQLLLYSKAEESFFKQKSRIQWLAEGDSNTKFFHNKVTSCQATNRILYLRNENGSKEYDPHRVKCRVVDYFQGLLGVANPMIRPPPAAFISDLNPYRCSPDVCAKLQKIPLAEEIKSTVFSMPNGKAPGPDGFPKEFYTTSWDIVGDSLIAAVQEFFTSGRLLKKYNSTAITLIPKIPNADTLQNFRPISCCNTTYKIISRILADRLKTTLPDLILPNQGGFLKGRLLVENVILATEILQDSHKPSAPLSGCLKIDLSKAFDNVDWNFILHCLTSLNFPPQFVGWISECISTTSYSIALNGELVGYFKGRKGLRQGDPISPYLFVLAMDVLSRMLDKGLEQGRFGSHQRCTNPQITHLSFADDVLIFFDGASSSLSSIIQILDEFRDISGLSLNKRKTELFISGNNRDLTSSIAAAQGLCLAEFPVRYLGLPLSSAKLTKADFQILYDKISGKLASWTNRTLSFAGRLQLIKSVIYGYFNFWFSAFIFPKYCLRRLESLCSSYLWHGCMGNSHGVKVSWEASCKPLSHGGLGLRKLETWNMIFGLKLIWMLFTKAGSLWVGWTKENLLADRFLWNAVDNKGSWLWRKLLKLRPIASRFLKAELGNGSQVSFWYDAWSPLGPLLEISSQSGPMRLGVPITSIVHQATRNNEWRFITSRSSRRNTLRNSIALLVAPSSQAGDDSFFWSLDYSQPARFSTATTWQALNNFGAETTWHSSVWFRNRIPKHSFITWLAALNRLSTRDRLHTWGLVTDTTCLLCAGQTESRSHIFFTCPYSQDIWASYSTVSTSFPLTFTEIIPWLSTLPYPISLIVKLLFQACLYNIWIERNTRHFNSVSRPASSLISEISRTVKNKLLVIDRETWRNPPTRPHTNLRTIWYQYFEPHNHHPPP